MAELKPCPFCGGEAYTYTCSTMRKGKLADLWIVHCKGCGLNYPPNIRGYRGEYEFEAIEAWNRRAEDGK
jgi:Lar family restriction alleviation protein